MMIMTEVGSVNDRVQRGIEWLDENAPCEWWDRVDYKILDLSDSEACVLGQIFAATAAETGWISGYHYAIRTDEFMHDNVVYFGFCPLMSEFSGERGDIIQDAWIDAIENRRALVSA